MKGHFIMVKAHQRQAHQPTIFACRVPAAREVFLAGTFNRWDPTKLPMHQDRDGAWKAALQLGPGRYEFKFVVDGKWCCDPEGGEACRDGGLYVPNPLGSMNCVVEVQ
jgi:1,4-alpha-glucan branching enzyme